MMKLLDEIEKKDEENLRLQKQIEEKDNEISEKDEEIVKLKKQVDDVVEDKVKRRQQNNPRGRERYAVNIGQMSGSMEKQTTEEESKSKWNKEPDQKTQRKGIGSSNREFLGKCFKCGETGHRSYECSQGTSKKGMTRNFMAREDKETEDTDKSVEKEKEVKNLSLVKNCCAEKRDAEGGMDLTKDLVDGSNSKVVPDDNKVRVMVVDKMNSCGRNKSDL
ncbi:uncharacterized protein LOC131876556 [Cryptomeria japonica]|uniref:uncharacterized protein LOC131876556 n=1 Tax=Cryptomeria japonica TaxID=3369 RepID=UPI0027DA9349|nr:uncharacterized protein LOC131876556 [Cryptomeria japonica]